MIKVSKYFLLSMAIIVTLCACTNNPLKKDDSSSDNNDVSIILDWFPNANHTGIYAGIKHNTFTNEGLNLSIHAPSDPTTVLALVADQKYDFGIFYQPDLLLARSEGVPAVAVAGIVNRPLNAMMTLKDSGIKRPSDLAGKKIGYPGIDWNRSMLATMLESDGLSLVDVELIDVGWSLAPTLLSGEVDAIIGAYWTHESIVMENEGYDIEIIKPDEWGVPPYYELVIVTSEQFFQEEKDKVKKFVRGLSNGYQHAISDPDGSLQALFAMSPPSVDRVIEEKGLVLLVPIWSETDEFGKIQSKKWNEFTDWMKRRKLLPETFDGNDAFQE